MASLTAVRPTPCAYCPYKRSCPSGVWDFDEYEKLRPYDAETFAQPTAGFRCHESPEQYCCGWAVTHTSRGHQFDLLALRIHWPDDGIPEAKMALFSSGAEAADHGQAAIHAPSAAATVAIERVLRKRSRSAEP